MYRGFTRSASRLALGSSRCFRTRHAAFRRRCSQAASVNVKVRNNASTYERFLHDAQGKYRLLGYFPQLQQGGLVSVSFPGRVRVLPMWAEHAEVYAMGPQSNKSNIEVHTGAEAFKKLADGAARSEEQFPAGVLHVSAAEGGQDDEIVVCVPQASNLQVFAGSHPVYISDKLEGTVHVRTTAGSITAHKLRGERVHLLSQSGDVSVSGVVEGELMLFGKRLHVQKVLASTADLQADLELTAGAIYAQEATVRVFSELGAPGDTGESAGPYDRSSATATSCSLGTVQGALVMYVHPGSGNKGAVSVGGLTGSMEAWLGAGVSMDVHLDEGERAAGAGAITVDAGGDVRVSLGRPARAHVRLTAGGEQGTASVHGPSGSLEGLTVHGDGARDGQGTGPSKHLAAPAVSPLEGSRYVKGLGQDGDGGAGRSMLPEDAEEEVCLSGRKVEGLLEVEGTGSGVAGWGEGEGVSGREGRGVQLDQGYGQGQGQGHSGKISDAGRLAASWRGRAGKALVEDNDAESGLSSPGGNGVGCGKIQLASRQGSVQVEVVGWSEMVRRKARARVAAKLTGK